MITKVLKLANTAVGTESTMAGKGCERSSIRISEALEKDAARKKEMRTNRFESWSSSGTEVVALCELTAVGPAY